MHVFCLQSHVCTETECAVRSRERSKSLEQTKAARALATVIESTCQAHIHCHLNFIVALLQSLLRESELSKLLTRDVGKIGTNQAQILLRCIHVHLLLEFFHGDTKWGWIVHG